MWLVQMIPIVPACPYNTMSSCGPVLVSTLGDIPVEHPLMHET